MLLTVLETPNSARGRYAVVVDLWSWPAGSRRNRGWEHAPVAYARPCTQAEMDEVVAGGRFYAHYYRAWEGLAADEMRLCGVDADRARSGYWDVLRRVLEGGESLPLSVPLSVCQVDPEVAEEVCRENRLAAYLHGRDARIDQWCPYRGGAARREYLRGAADEGVFVCRAVGGERLR